MLKIRKGDTVQVIKGKDRGKKGRIVKLWTEQERAFVEGINMVKKHKRKTRQDQQGGIVSIEAPISVSNIMFFCKHCNRSSRMGFKIMPDNSKARVCKRCQEAV